LPDKGFKIYLTSAQNTPNDNIGEKLVVIDAGHGGYDPGAIGYEDEKDVLHESDVNLDISKKVYDILKDRGVNAVLTRSADVYVGLSERAEVANDLDASLFISVHINSSTIATAHGSMTFYYNSGEDTTTEDTYGISSKKLAEIIQKHLIAHGGRYDRGKSDGSKLVVLKSTIMPAVLVECAFISNDEERELLKTDSFRQSLAEGIAEGIIEALKTMGERKPSENQDTEKAISN
jgi:N-acetylmuramoyl-L-alanine amidase